MQNCRCNVDYSEYTAVLKGSLTAAITYNAPAKDHSAGTTAVASSGFRRRDHSRKISAIAQVDLHAATTYLLLCVHSLEICRRAGDGAQIHSSRSPRSFVSDHGACIHLARPLTFLLRGRDADAFVTDRGE